MFACKSSSCELPCVILFLTGDSWLFKTFVITCIFHVVARPAVHSTVSFMYSQHTTTQNSIYWSTRERDRSHLYEYIDMFCFIAVLRWGMLDSARTLHMIVNYICLLVLSVHMNATNDLTQNLRYLHAFFFLFSFFLFSFFPFFLSKCPQTILCTCIYIYICSPFSFLCSVPPPFFFPSRSSRFLSLYILIIFSFEWVFPRVFHSGNVFLVWPRLNENPFISRLEWDDQIINQLTPDVRACVCAYMCVPARVGSCFAVLWEEVQRAAKAEGSSAVRAKRLLRRGFRHLRCRCGVRIFDQVSFLFHFFLPHRFNRVWHLQRLRIMSSSRSPRIRGRNIPTAML